MSLPNRLGIGEELSNMAVGAVVAPTTERLWLYTFVAGVAVTVIAAGEITALPKMGDVVV